MAFSAATLASGLDLPPTTTEADAIDAFTAAFSAYFDESTVSGIAVTPGSTALAETAMKAAMVGMSATGQGAAKITAGVTAFWTTVLPLVTTIWITAPIVLVPPAAPPVLPPLTALLVASFLATTSASGSSADAAQDMADIIHGLHIAVPPIVLGSIPPATPAPIPVI